MLPLNLFLLPTVVFVRPILASISVRVLRQYERTVVFRLGNFHGVKGPGLIFLTPLARQMVRQLRYLKTLTGIGGEQNSTIVFPMPIDLIKPFFDILEKTDKVIGTSAAAAPSVSQPVQIG